MCDADDVIAGGWVRAMGSALDDHEFVTGPLDVDRLNPAWVVESRGRAIEAGPGDFHGVFPFGTAATPVSQGDRHPCGA